MNSSLKQRKFNSRLQMLALPARGLPLGPSLSQSFKGARYEQAQDSDYVTRQSQCLGRVPAEWSTNPNPARRNRMRKLSRRSLVASAATLPALVVPAASATAIATASGDPDSRLLELERRIVALDAASTETGVPWNEAEDTMFAWKRRNPEPKEKETEPPKLGPDPDLERALDKYGDRISRKVRDILSILMEPRPIRRSVPNTKGNFHAGMNGAAPLVSTVVMTSVSTNLRVSLTKLMRFVRKPPALCRTRLTAYGAKRGY